MQEYCRNNDVVVPTGKGDYLLGVISGSGGSSIDIAGLLGGGVGVLNSGSGVGSRGGVGVGSLGGGGGVGSLGGGGVGSCGGGGVGSLSSSISKYCWNTS